MNGWHFAHCCMWQGNKLVVFLNLQVPSKTAWYFWVEDLHHVIKFTVLPRFRMCFCLFVVMGINWVMEIVSWFGRGPDYIWYVTDTINTLQGVIIFLIFVLEPRVRSCVWKQWGPKLSQILCRKQPNHASVIYQRPKDAFVWNNL
jgi:hypothetical protein